MCERFRIERTCLDKKGLISLPYSGLRYEHQNRGDPIPSRLFTLLVLDRDQLNAMFLPRKGLIGKLRYIFGIFVVGADLEIERVGSSNLANVFRSMWEFED